MNKKPKVLKSIPVKFNEEVMNFIKGNWSFKINQSL